MKPTSNCCVVPGWVRGGSPIFTLTLLFLLKLDSQFSVIAIHSVFTVRLNSSGRAEIGMSLPDFGEEELDI